MLSRLLITALIVAVLVYLWLDYRNDLKRISQAVHVADDTKQWPTLLDCICAVLFVILFFGLFTFVGHAAGLDGS